MTRIKICGLTRAEDVDCALAHGADLLGFIHVPSSRRHLELLELKTLLARVSGRASTVIVVQNTAPGQLDLLRETLDFDYFQFHGSESPEDVRRWRGYKVIHVRDRAPDPAMIETYGSPFLLDTVIGNRQGGTGLAFDWSILAGLRGDYLVAGGLNPENVSELVRRYRPWGVDVSSGVESKPGKKDHRKVKEFINKVRRPYAA